MAGVLTAGSGQEAIICRRLRDYFFNESYPIIL